MIALVQRILKYIIVREITLFESFKNEWNDIFVYIKDSFGISIADIINSELENMLTLLATFPGIGKSNLKDKRLRTFFKKNVLVFSFQESEIQLFKIINKRSIK